MASKSILSFCTSTGILPTACTPSTAKNTPCSFAILPISAMGLMMPISLFAYMIVVKMVLGGHAQDHLDHNHVCEQRTRHHQSHRRNRPNRERASPVLCRAWCAGYRQCSILGAD